MSFTSDKKVNYSAFKQTFRQQLHSEVKCMVFSTKRLLFYQTNENHQQMSMTIDSNLRNKCYQENVTCGYVMVVNWTISININ